MRRFAARHARGDLARPPHARLTLAGSTHDRSTLAAPTLARSTLAGLILAALTLAATLSACGGSAAAQRFAVARQVETFTDTSRSTPANGAVAGHSGRTLVTTIYYPASGGPFPLIVFAHGFTGLGTDYQALLSAWAATGYVVAAPNFPLSSRTAAGGPSIADYFEQPADMSFVITSVLNLSGGHTGPLSGRVEPSHVGAAGQSLGGITTLGLATNTCCRDKRVAAAAAMAGDAIGFQGGTYTNKGTPPLLLLHGDRDQTVPYQASRDAYSTAAPPKFLVTLLGGDHIGPYLIPTSPWFNVVVRTTLDFFDTCLKGKRTELSRVESDGDVPGVAKEEQVLAGPAPTPTSSTTVVGAAGNPSNSRSATAVPDSALSDGQRVQVSWRGFAPGSLLNILECTGQATGPADCDLGRALLFQPAGPRGSGELPFAVHLGPIGRGRCDATNSCLIAVNESGNQAAGATVAAAIKFAPAP